MASPPRRRASPPYLPDELVEEILLRLPPDDPACILRASLVCKTWSSAISHPRFRRRLHDLHRTPPVLGVLHNWKNEHIPQFVPTTASSFSLAAPDYRFWQAVEFRHGRALFLSKVQATRELLLWEPMTGAQSRVPVPPAAFKSVEPTAAVVCAADGCDHRDCLGRPFLVVFVFALEYETDDEEYVTKACVYSSETGTWGEPTSLSGVFGNFGDTSSVLVEKSSLLYFMSYIGMILEYDLARHSLAVLKAPDNKPYWDYDCNLFLTEDGGLGVSQAMEIPLKLWSWKVNDGTDHGQWVLSRVIHLENLLPNAPLVGVLGFAEGSNVIFVLTFAGLFTIQLQSGRVRKVCGNYGFCNLIPVVGFYTPRSRLKVLGGKHHYLPPLRNPTKEETTLEFAHELFAKGCKAMQEGNFPNASDCLDRALKIRVLHYGIFAPQCAHTYYRYGRALLCKAQVATNPSVSVPKSALNEESVKITATDSKDAGSSSASVSNSEHIPPSHRGDSEEGENLNSKDQEDVTLTCNEANSDLYLAWKMLDIARGIVEKNPEKTMEKVNIFYAHAEVCMKREDRDAAIGYYLEALAILEHLKPDHIGVVHLNFCICLAFELASKVGDAIPYCEKAISVCQSLQQSLKNAKEALLADIDVIASAAKGHSGKFTLEDEISFLSRIFPRLQNKLEELDRSNQFQSQALA